MRKIREHLQPDELDFPTHYNRAFEAVYEVLKENITDDGFNKMPLTNPRLIPNRCVLCGHAI